MMRFEGPVEVRCGPCAAQGFTLVGVQHGRPREPLHLSILCAPPAGLPARLESPSVELEGTSARIIMGNREWEIAPRASFAHRDATDAFGAAIPAERAPLSKRLFWRVILALAASPLGRAWLARRAGAA